MTEAPLVGLWCTGRNALELAVSVHCSRKVMAILRDAGYSLGSCYTEITLPHSTQKMTVELKTMKRLCVASDLVLTFGCEGFSEGDVVPDITMRASDTTVTYFSNVLCGSVGVSVPDKDSSERGDGKLRLYPEEDEFCRRALARGRYHNGSKPYRTQAFTSENNSDTDALYHRCPPVQEMSGFIKLRPSRAVSVICEKALVLNLTNDVSKAGEAVKALLPAIGFTVYNLSGKSAAFYICEENSLKATPEFQNFFTNNSIVNN